MDYSKFGVEDFLCDTSFLEYCLGTNEQAVLFWTEWLKDHPEKVRTANSAQALYYTLNGNISAENFHEDYQVFKNAIGVKNHGDALPVQSEASAIISAGRFNRSLVFSLIGVAACLLIVFGLFLFRSGKIKGPVSAEQLSYNTPLGKKDTVRLPDGSVVMLNSGSQLKISSGFNVKRRDVVLTGEGYFVIAHNAAKPFVVHTNKINIKDIGTEFNVKAYPADKTTEASLIKGLVEITVNGHSMAHKDQKSIILSPNNKFIIVNTADVTDEQKVSNHVFAVGHITTNTSTNSVVETDWTKNKLTFYDQSLDDIAIQMERWYGVKILISNPAIKAYRFTATFDHENIAQVLEALKLSSNFNYRKEDNVISIY